eukprot:GSChrysophyteH2.ASY1.ANO1.413.1 assembled CDS
MYASGKENGGVVGRICGSGGPEPDLAEMADATGCEESLRCGDANGQAMTLSGRLDPATGDLAWVREEDEEAVNSRVLGTNQMPSMLHDVGRNAIYEGAIQVIVNNFAKVQGRMPRVLDVGCGTGLLSMMAVRAGADSVVGCEMFHVAMQDRITVIPAKSTDIDFPTPAAQADILISELLDSALLGESVVYSHADAIQRLLDRVLPHSSSLFATLVQSKEVHAMHDIPATTNDNANANTGAAASEVSPLSPWRNSLACSCSGGWPLIPLHWSRLLHRSTPSTSTATECLFMDFTKSQSQLENDSGGSENQQYCYDTVVTATAAGDITGVLLYWDLYLLSPDLDPKREHVYSTNPHTNPLADKPHRWQDHWVQCVFPLPTTISVTVGQEIQLTVHHNNVNIWLESSPSSSSTSMARRACEDCGPTPCTCGWHLLLPTDRILMLNDEYRSSCYYKAIKYLADETLAFVKSTELLGIAYNPIALNLGDSNVLALQMAHYMKAQAMKLEAAKVEALDPDNCLIIDQVNSPGSREAAKILGPKPASCASNDLHDHFDCWNGESIMEWDSYFEDEGDSESEQEQEQEQEQEKELQSRVVSLVSDCYWFQLQARPVWQALSFHYQRTALDQLLLASPR